MVKFHQLSLCFTWFFSLVGTYSVPGTYRIRYLARAYGSDISEFGDNADGNILEFKAWEDSGDLVAEYRLDEPDTIYQRNYASPITDVNDPEWSGAILQNTLLGDWEEVYQESEQTPWKGKIDERALV